MSNAYLSPILQDAQFNDDCTFLAGGLIWFYQAGTTTPLLAYTGPDASIAWTNPIVLDQRGETGGEIWLKAGQAYKMVLEEPPQYGQTNGVVVSTFDNISGVNDPGTASIQNWIAFAGTPTYISATSFTVAGDHRTTFLESRRLKTTNTLGLVYSTVVSSTYASSVTTVVVSNDYGLSLDSGLSAVSYGFIETGAASSIPVAVNAGSASGGSQYQMWIDYDGTNLKWSKDADVASATWPINAITADAASGSFFSTKSGAGEGRLIAAMSGQNDVYVYNNSTDWGIYSSASGPGVNFNKATSTFSFGGFTLPNPASTKYIKLPNGLIIQFGQGTASNSGNAVTFPTTFPTQCFAVLATQVGSTRLAISANNLTTTGVTLYCSSTEPASYIALGF